MATEPSIGTTCYLCGEGFTYSPDLANQVVECPKCNQRIKLFVPQTPVTNPAPPANSLLGKFLGFAFLIVFLATALFSPWILTLSDDEYRQFHPLFMPPESGIWRLDTETLLLEWICLVVAFFCVNQVCVKLTKSQSGSKSPPKDVNLPLVAFVVLCLLSTVGFIRGGRSYRMADKASKAVVAMSAEVSQMANEITEINSGLLDSPGPFNLSLPNREESIRDMLRQIQQDLRTRRRE